MKFKKKDIVEPNANSKFPVILEFQIYQLKSYLHKSSEVF